MSDEKEKEEKKLSEKVLDAYGKDEEEGKYAQTRIQQVNEDLELREKEGLVFNGLSYSQAYEYNERKGINYAPPKNKNDDREVSMGLVHEKIISFASIFLKYVFKRTVKCYDEKGRLIKGLGKIYDLSISFSHKLEKFSKKIALIYWEVFTQGNAFILEDWEVKTLNLQKAYQKKDGKKVLVTPDTMDYTYEFLDGLSYEDGEQIQVRRAVSRLLDGRSVIFGDPEIEDIQDQPRITIEFKFTKADAKAVFGTLKRWDAVPKTQQDITTFLGVDKSTLFDSNRHKDPADVFLGHLCLDKENNRYNWFLNGMMMLPRKTPMTLFHPRGNYPLTNIPAERLRGSIYSRSVPAKTKFNADFLDWCLKMLANKFEQGIDPAILAKGKYTLTRDMFRGGQVTHGVTKDDFEKADPENKGITNNEVTFVELLKDITESQTLNPTTSGELSANATATEISTIESNQRDKLAYLLDGMVNGFMDMALRRAETIESKYTIKQKETMVDGKKISVYQNFTVNVAGIENVVVFDEQVGEEGYDVEGKREELFENAFNEKKRGYPTEFYLANPIMIREKRYHLDIEIKPERIKDTQLHLMQMWDDFIQRMNVFGEHNNIEEMKKEYLEISGKPDEIFTTQVYQQLEREEEGTAHNTGSFGKPAQKPTIKSASKQEASIKT